MKQSSREIWSWNKEKEMKSVRQCLQSFRFIAIDTEFPGCLKETSMEASEEIRYKDMRYNIHKTKLIQFGFTLFDGEGRIGGTWEVNFSDFIESKDANNSKSMEFLRRNGLNLEKIREEGVGIDEFFKEFTQILNESKSEKKMTWITFHGSYDKAYLVKGFTGGRILPETSQDFAQVVERLLGDVVDVKEIAGLGLFPALSSHFGLQRVADAFQIRRVGKAHHAGSDSELTARVFIKMAPILSQDYKRKKMRLRDHQQARVRADQHYLDDHDQQYLLDLIKADQQYLLEQEELMKRRTTCYVPQPQPLPLPLRPRPMMFPAYPPFGGYFVVPLQRFNYV